MAQKWPGWILRAREDPPRISYLELFFDLGLVVALTRISQRFASDLHGFNVLQTVVLLAAIWWVWTVTAYTTDWYDPELPVVQLIVLTVLLGGLLMAVAVQNAFDGWKGFAFAGPYVGLHLFRGIVLVTALRRHELRRRPLRVLIWFGLTGVLWLTGAVLPSHARLALWAVAITVDYTIGLFGYPLPRLGRSSAEELRVASEHHSERYRQIFVVALGEILLMAVLNFRAADFTSVTMGGFVLMFVSALALWRLYLVYVGRHLAAGIEQSANPGRAAAVAAYPHLIMVAGVTLIAAGGELVLADPTGRTPLSWLAVLVAGPVVFLIGRTLFAMQVFGAPRWRLPAGAILILVLAPALTHLPPIGVEATINGLLVLVAFAPVPGGRMPATNVAPDRR